jgi:hypothetical protein
VALSINPCVELLALDQLTFGRFAPPLRPQAYSRCERLQFPWMEPPSFGLRAFTALEAAKCPPGQLRARRPAGHGYRHLHVSVSAAASDQLKPFPELQDNDNVRRKRSL